MRRLVGQDYGRSPAERVSDWVTENTLKIGLTVALSVAFWFLLDGLIALANFIKSGGETGHSDLFAPDPTFVLAIKIIGILIVAFLVCRKRS